VIRQAGGATSCPERHGNTRLAILTWLLGGLVSDSDLYRHVTGTDAQFNPEDHILILLTKALHDPHVLRVLLQDFSLDQATFFGRYGCTQGTFLNTTENLLAKEQAGSRNPMWSVLLVFGRSIEYSSRYARGDEEPTAAEIDYLQRLLIDSADVAVVLNSIYHFDELAPGALPPLKHSMSLDWQTLDVHRLGTTSLIFSVYGAGVDTRKFALKLSHVLFTTVGPIASSTSSYFHEWRDVSRTCPFTPRIIASGTGWILEEFIEGPTLREFVRDHQSIDPLGLTLSVLPPILEALESFHSANHGLGHGDLNPANIIIQKRSAAPTEISARDSHYEYVAFLIDMGRNLLASDTIGRVRSVDTAFVAPEVREMPPDQGVVDRSADFFSLGHILAFCLGYDRTDGFYYVDERLFRDQPMLARLVCGLINNKASARVRYVNGLRDAKRGPVADELEVLNEYSSALIQIL
jgi:serine/threonine protein kinase